MRRFRLQEQIDRNRAIRNSRHNPALIVTFECYDPISFHSFERSGEIGLLPARHFR